jgi:hypothetical protein
LKTEKSGPGWFYQFTKNRLARFKILKNENRKNRAINQKNQVINQEN